MISALTRSYNFLCTSTDPNQPYIIVITYTAKGFLQSNSADDRNVHTINKLNITRSYYIYI